MVNPGTCYDLQYVSACVCVPLSVWRREWPFSGSPFDYNLNLISDYKWCRLLLYISMNYAIFLSEKLSIAKYRWSEHEYISLSNYIVRGLALSLHYACIRCIILVQGSDKHGMCFGPPNVGIYLYRGVISMSSILDHKKIQLIWNSFCWELTFCL